MYQLPIDIQHADNPRSVFEFNAEHRELFRKVLAEINQLTVWEHDEYVGQIIHVPMLLKDTQS